MYFGGGGGGGLGAFPNFDMSSTPPPPGFWHWAFDPLEQNSEIDTAKSIRFESFYMFITFIVMNLCRIYVRTYLNPKKVDLQFHVDLFSLYAHYMYVLQQQVLQRFYRRFITRPL